MNAYEILEVPKDASTVNIKASYKKLVYAWHPDRFPNDDAKKAEGGKRMEYLNRAWFCLSDEDRRRRYDVYGEAGVGTSAASEQDFIETSTVEVGVNPLEADSLLKLLITGLDVFFFLLETLLRALSPLFIDGGALALKRIQNAFSTTGSGKSWQRLTSLDANEK